MSEYEIEHGEDREIEPDTVGVKDYEGMGEDARAARIKSDWDELIGDDTLFDMTKWEFMEMMETKDRAMKEVYADERTTAVDEFME